jgi:hypothetical protein
MCLLFIVNVYFLPLFPSPDCNGNPFLVAEATEAAKKDCNGKREKAPKKIKRESSRFSV